jgi:hypothetical protein
MDNDTCCIDHAVNACEVYYDCLRKRDEGQADLAINSLISGDVVIREDMDADFWKAKWEKGEIAFHEREANPLLERKAGTFYISGIGERPKLTS